MKHMSTTIGQYKDPRKIGRVADAILTMMFSLICLTCIIPVLLVVSASFTSETALNKYGYLLIPKEFSLSAYRYLFRSGQQILHSYGVTITVTLLGTFLSLLFVSMFAYVISRKYFKYRMFLSFFVFFTMLFSGGMVPSYIINSRYLHLNDTIWALILPIMVNGFYIMVLRTFYTTAIPDTLVDAAKIDGAGEFRCYYQIILPLSKPGIATIGLFTVIGYWNDWMSAMLYVTDQDLAPIQYTLMKIQKNLEFIKNNMQGMSPELMKEIRNAPTDSTQMALTVLVITPLLFAYPFFQRYFIAGLTIGGVKG